MLKYLIILGAGRSINSIDSGSLTNESILIIRYYTGR